MALSVQKLKSAGPGRHGDGRGLFFYVKPTGARSWVLRYQVQGRRRDLGLGAYPDVTLAMARDRAAEARRLIAEMQVFEDIRAEEQGGANVPGVKAALSLMGEDCGIARPPAAWPLSQDQMTRLRAFMTTNGLI